MIYWWSFKNREVKLNYTLILQYNYVLHETSDSTGEIKTKTVLNYMYSSAKL